MNLEQFKTDDGIELYIDTETGMSFASQSGYARMSGVSETAVRKRIKTENLIGSEEAEILSQQGVEASHHSVIKAVAKTTRGSHVSVNLLNEDWIVKNLQKDNPSLLAKFSKLGVRASLHQMAGFEVTSTAVKEEAPLSLVDAAIALAEDLKAKREEVKELQSQLGNAEQSVKDNLEKFESFFDADLSFEENVGKFGEIIISYKEQVMWLNHQKEQLETLTKDNVNHFIYCKGGNKLDDSERKSFGRLVKKICVNHLFDFDEKTNLKDGYDLNNNHYPLCLLERIYDLVCGGYQYAQIVEIYTELE